MELSEFIKSVLTQINDGVHDAQSQISEIDAVINPHADQIQLIEFDIMLVNANNGFGVDLSRSQSRTGAILKFNVPVFLPENK